MQINKRNEKRKDELMAGGVDERVGGWMSEWVTDWVDDWVDGWVNE